MSAAAHALAPAHHDPPVTTAPARVPSRRPYRPSHVASGTRAERTSLGDPTALVCTAARIALDVVLGGEGINQLVRWIAPEVRTCLLTQRSYARASGYRVKGAVHVQRVRLCRVGPEAVEAAVVATEGDVPHALALRLEAVGSRWLITVLDVG